MSVRSDLEQRPWPLQRWGTMILLVFGLQVGLIFWLSDRTPLQPRVHAPVPVLHLAGSAPPEFWVLNDPTWFALPHRQGFSGLAWLKVPEPEFHPLTWTTPPAWLELPAQQTGAALATFVRSNDFGAAALTATPELVLTLPEPDPIPLARERTELRLEGGLAHRTLLTPFDPKPQAATELLTNSVVQAVVDAKGWPQSVALLWKSGSAQADQEALAFAAHARFAPVPRSAGKAALGSLTEGLLVFAWHTVPKTAAPDATQK